MKLRSEETDFFSNPWAKLFRFSADQIHKNGKSDLICHFGRFGLPWAIILHWNSAEWEIEINRMPLYGGEFSTWEFQSIYLHLEYVPLYFTMPLTADFFTNTQRLYRDLRILLRIVSSRPGLSASKVENPFSQTNSSSRLNRYLTVKKLVIKNRYFCN